jgi:RHS repeat-associated protein
METDREIILITHNNQLINDGTRQFSYDATGRAVTVGSDNIEYDVFSNMTNYNNDTYTYNADNQRIKKVENNDTTYYIRDGLNTLAEYDGSGNHLADYVYGISGMAAKVDLATGYYWYYKDHLGSTRQLGSSNLFRDYYPFGVSLAESGTETGYLFAGKELDGRTGLSYFGARYYDARIGRWWVVDPLGEEWSPYIYCGNNPIIYFDSNGEYKLSSELQSNKKFNQMLKVMDIFIKSNPMVEQAFSQLNTSISDFMTPGKGPLIITSNIPHIGRYQKNRTSDLHTIEISDEVVNRFSHSSNIEEKAFYISHLIRNLFHETAHWAWLINKKGYKRISNKEGKLNNLTPKGPKDKYGNCLGNGIELLIFGNFYDTDENLNYYDPINNPYVNASGEYQKDPFVNWLEMQLEYED